MLMPSQPRFAILEDHATFHVTWQCHNHDWLLSADWAKDLYYQLLLQFKVRYGVEIYSYCFMDNHPHLSGKLRDLKSFSDFFRVVNSRFAREYNKQMNRRGQVVMGRFKSPQIQTEADLLKVMLYIDLNPKRAGKVRSPKENNYSSFRYYAYGETDPLITPAPPYLALGNTPQERQECYRELIGEILKNDWKEKKSYSTVSFIGNPNWVLKKMAELTEIRREQRRLWWALHKQRFRSRS